ncbi:hypothetical protein AB1Y20_008079 [Prymnesium parvum]|uniref:Uncharacterized protein n=1 Tax=Prymnesium parvum TaxID=97485 RepID=A0AB34IWU2_PRYPA
MSATEGLEGMRLDQQAPPGSDRAAAAGLDGAPLVLRYAARKLVAHPMLVSELRFGCCGLTDEHIPALVGALSFSQSKLQVLDLVFNHITDKGLAQLCKAVAAEGGADLTEIFLGGNESTAEGRAELTATLQTACPLLRVEWTPRLHKAEPLATVGLVYKNSPAKRAGLLQGDKVMAWGMLQTGCNLHNRFGFQPDYGNDPSDPFLRACKFENVLQSISPVVRSSISQPIDVVVERVTDAGRAEQFMLTLVPERWSGQGLIGCILK